MAECIFVQYELRTFESSDLAGEMNVEEYIEECRLCAGSASFV